MTALKPVIPVLVLNACDDTSRMQRAQVKCETAALSSTLLALLAMRCSRLWRLDDDHRGDVPVVKQRVALITENGKLAVPVGRLPVPFRPVYSNPTSLSRIDPERSKRTHRQLIANLFDVLHDNYLISSAAQSRLNSNKGVTRSAGAGIDSDSTSNASTARSATKSTCEKNLDRPISFL